MSVDTGSELTVPRTVPLCGEGEVRTDGDGDASSAGVALSIGDGVRSISAGLTTPTSRFAISGARACLARRAVAK